MTNRELIVELLKSDLDEISYVNVKTCNKEGMVNPHSTHMPIDCVKNGEIVVVERE